MFHEWSPLKKLIWLRRVATGAKAVLQTITGVAPLAFTAVKKAIASLIQYGKTVQDGTPTPEAPVDIVCNNGALKYGALGANLFDPSPSAILLNYYRNSTTGVLTPSVPNFISAGYIPIKPNTSYILVGRSKSDNTISAWNRIYWFDADKEFISTCPYTQDRATVAVSPANAAYAQYGINYNNSFTNVLTQAEVDSYNWTFCEGTAEPATFAPYVGGIYTDGTPEVLTVGKNLFSQDSYLDAYCSAGGTITAHNSSRCFVMECKPNTEYRFIFDNSAISSPRCVINGFAAQPEIGMRSKQVCYSSSNTSPMLHDTTFTTGADVHYLVMWLMYQKSDDDTKAAVNKAILMETATAQTATVPDLYAVGDYRDEVDLVSGTVTRRVGVKVLDGTEAWTKQTSSARFMFYVNELLTDARNVSSKRDVMLSNIAVHVANAWGDTKNAFVMRSNGKGIGFQNPSNFTSSATVEDWTAYLAAQYAAGTPVIVLYPLAKETTEQVAGQPLRTSAGTSVVSVTSNVDPVELKVEYYG